MEAHDPPRLIADVGGTYSRFALETAPMRFEHVASLRSGDYPDFHAAVRAYLDGLSLRAVGPIRHAALAIANPVEGDRVRMTNYHWQFSIEEMRNRLALETLVVVNDFTALALALPRLKPSQRRQVGGGAPRERSVIGLLGAGSGLGVSGLIPAAEGWVALGTEGGHASFAPRDERELDILRYAMRQYSHVSFERLLSGPGIELIYRALCHRAGLPEVHRAAPEISQRALEQGEPIALQTLEAFCAMLGTAASNLAVTQGAFGGIFIGGGIVPRLGSWFDTSPFRSRFEDKGRFRDYLEGIPTYVITAENATFLGVSAVLSEQLRRMDVRSGSAILGQIQRLRPNLSPAERRVADHVLGHPRAALNDPIAAIARAAQVSQPTVIRFCRSLGCEGLSDFKLRLASGLTGTIPVTHTQVTGEDTMLELGEKVLGNTASAILQVRDQLNRETVDRAVELLTDAQRVDFYAEGPYRVVAEDVQIKFLRFGIPSMACVELALHATSAGVLQPGAVAVLISGGARPDELLEVADMARQRGAKVLAITTSQSPLARKADVALIVDHVEDLATQVPMISRILHLLVVDILAVGVSMRRGAVAVAALPGHSTPRSEGPGAGRPSTLGVRASGALSQMVSHSR